MIRFEAPLLQDVQQSPPCGFCKRCGGEIYHEATITEDGGRMHLECFDEYIEELLTTNRALVAECMGMRYEEAT